MKPRTIALLAIAVALAAWMFRYEFVSSKNGTVYRHDRWTGEVQFIDGESSYRVSPYP